jgi:hypothetical protein
VLTHEEVDRFWLQAKKSDDGDVGLENRRGFRRYAACSEAEIRDSRSFMFSLLFGHASRKHLVIGLLLTALGVAFCVARAADPTFLSFRVYRNIAFYLMIILGLIICWPVRLSGYRKKIALTLAILLGSAAFILLVIGWHLPAILCCLFAQMEWVGYQNKPASIREFFKRSNAP